MEQLDTLLYEGKYPDSTWHKANLSTHQAQVLCRMKKTDEAIKKLHEARQTAANYDHQTEDITVHTLLMGETIFSRKNVETSDSRSLSNIVTEKWLTHTDFDPIRNEL
jgi:hypothetical protein